MLADRLAASRRPHWPQVNAVGFCYRRPLRLAARSSTGDGGGLLFLV